MASTNPHRRQISPFKAVIQCPLSAEEAPKVVGFLDDGEHIDQLLEVLGETGYEVSYRYDDDRKTHSICVKGVSPDCLNAGKWMYGNGSTLRLAFASAFYKHFEVFQQGAWSSRIDENNLGVS